MVLDSERPTLTTDIAIVGGGIIGRAVALELASHNIEIVLIDSSAPEHRPASLAAGAMLGAFGEVTTQEKVPGEDIDLAARVKASDLYESWLASLPGCTSASILRCGTLIIASGRSRQDQSNISAIKEALEYYSREYQSVDTDDLAYINPTSEWPIKEAIYIPSEGAVNTPELVTCLGTALQAHPHVTLLPESAELLLGRDDRVTGIATATSLVRAKWVVLAAGVHINKLISTYPLAASIVPPLLEGKGTSIILESADVLPNVVRTPNREFACGLHLVPRGRSTYLGATNRASSVIGASGGATASEVHYLLDSAIHELDTRLAKADVISVAAGSRPISPDRRPLVGITELQGLAIATATYRNGVLLAPYVSRILADEIIGNASDSMNSFSPVGRMRKIATSIQTAREILSTAAGDLFSMFIEPRGSLPYGHDQELRRLFELLISLINDSQDPVIQDICDCTIDKFPIEEIVPELLYRFLLIEPREHRPAEKHSPRAGPPIR